MCGIAGFSLNSSSSADVTAMARVLLASVAERGADASGCVYEHHGKIIVLKQPGGASSFLSQISLPHDVRGLLMHVRDHTKGRPSLPANNHPITHGRIIGVHNGRVENDEQVFSTLGRDRAEPGMTVDSEAIFAALDDCDSAVDAFEMIEGSVATGWIDAATPRSVFLARGFGRPLWKGHFSGGILWASTLEALEIAEEFLGISLHKRPIRPGTILEMCDGAIITRRSYRPDASATWLVNPVASPAERTACLRQIDAEIA